MHGVCSIESETRLLHFMWLWYHYFDVNKQPECSQIRVFLP